LMAAAFAATPATALAQPATPPPPPGWVGSASAGLALTQGNSDTSTVNAAYELKRDTGGAMLFRSTGLLVWGKSEDVLTSDRLGLDGRVEWKLGSVTSMFSAIQYFRDSAKSIDYLVSPTLGVTRMLVKNDGTELRIDGGFGVVWEQNPDAALRTDGAITAGQQYARKLTATTELKQKLAALWKVFDLDDALYSFGIGIATSVTAGTQLNVEFLDTFKAHPRSPGVKQNDIAVLVSFVYKFE
jgi:putative salt-induced outer membrane protein YdiY